MVIEQSCNYSVRLGFFLRFCHQITKSNKRLDLTISEKLSPGS